MECKATNCEKRKTSKGSYKLNGAVYSEEVSCAENCGWLQEEKSEGRI